MMTLKTSQPYSDSACCLSIRVCAPDGGVRNHELPHGQVLVVGSSPACGLRLDAPNIAGMHCTIEFNESGLTVRDWSTESGTFLDGRQIEEERVRATAFELRIGGFLLQSKLSTFGTTKPSPNKQIAIGSETNRSASGNESQVDADSDSLTQESELETDRDDHSADQRRDLASDIFDADQSKESSSDVSLEEGGADSDAWDRDFDPWDTPDKEDSLAASDQRERLTEYSPPDETHDDIAELLQTEVEFLRSELAEREERLRALEELAQFDAGEESTEEIVSASEVEKLVARLEQLLAELEQSDLRIAALNEVLRTSEEAVHTADQEREQLESWLAEVDERVGQWEQESHAERDSLRKTIAELTEQRDRAEHTVATGGATETSGAARDQLVTRLREEYSRLKASFLKTEQERDQLRGRLNEASVSDAEQRIATAVDRALREERLQLAQEKASLAREKSTLAKRQEEIQAQLDRKALDGESADHRIRAFREHLREIHENEPDRPHSPTLSQRMGKLWRKLEGRPLDTD